MLIKGLIPFKPSIDQAIASLYFLESLEVYVIQAQLMQLI